MGFSMINNSSLSVAISLLLIVLLSQARVFNILLDTAWGRFVLIAFIIVISYLNKILGVVAVLFVIILFNQSDIALFEGFTSDASGNIQDKLSDASGNIQSNMSDASGNIQDNISDASGNFQKMVKAKLEEKQESKNAQEGFDMIGTENMIKRGKQSNSIPVNNDNNTSEDVNAYEGFTNTQTFSLF